MSFAPTASLTVGAMSSLNRFKTCSQLIEEIPPVESVPKEDLFGRGDEETIFPLSCDFYHYECCCHEMLPAPVAMESSCSVVYRTSSGGNKGTVVAVGVIVLSALGTKMSQRGISRSKLPRRLILKEPIRLQKEVLL